MGRFESERDPCDESGGPAVIYPTGERAWFVHGERKRTGGRPRAEYPDGSGEHYRDGHLIAPVSPERAEQIAATTRAQIEPGILMSVGAPGFCHDSTDGALVFTCTSQPRTSTMRVTLDPSDTYRVVMSRPKRGDKFTTERVEDHEGIYAEQLSRLILSFDR